MTTVALDKELAEELVDMKLSYLQSEIQKILKSWNYQSAAQFLKCAKDGTIEEAEDDAITLRHLLDQRENLIKLKEKWS